MRNRRSPPAMFAWPPPCPLPAVGAGWVKGMSPQTANRTRASSFMVGDDDGDCAGASAPGIFSRRVGVSPRVLRRLSDRIRHAEMHARSIEAGDRRITGPRREARRRRRGGRAWWRCRRRQDRAAGRGPRRTRGRRHNGAAGGGGGGQLSHFFLPQLWQPATVAKTTAGRSRGGGESSRHPPWAIGTA